MHIGRVAGATRNLGAPKDWDPAKDGVCGGLPIRDEPHSPGVNRMVSAWLPTMEEIALMVAGAPIYLSVLGTPHPPVWFSSASRRRRKLSRRRPVAETKLPTSGRNASGRLVNHLGRDATRTERHQTHTCRNDGQHEQQKQRLTELGRMPFRLAERECSCGEDGNHHDRHDEDERHRMLLANTQRQAEPQVAAEARR